MSTKWPMLITSRLYSKLVWLLFTSFIAEKLTKIVCVFGRERERSKEKKWWRRNTQRRILKWKRAHNEIETFRIGSLNVYFVLEYDESTPSIALLTVVGRFFSHTNQTVNKANFIAFQYDNERFKSKRPFHNRLGIVAIIIISTDWILHRIFLLHFDDKSTLIFIQGHTGSLQRDSFSFLIFSPLRHYERHTQNLNKVLEPIIVSRRKRDGREKPNCKAHRVNNSSR